MLRTLFQATRARHSQDREAGPVVLVLLAVLLPAACLLWFMAAAMRNERLAARQKLAEVYRAQLATSRSRLQQHWRDTAAELERWAAASPASAAFAQCVRSGLVDSAIIFDEQGRISYPNLPAATPGHFGEQETKRLGANRLEAMRHYVEAASGYDALARDTADDNAAARAFQAETRCLVQAGENEAAIQLVNAVFNSERYRRAADPQGRLIAANVEWLALELITNRNSAAFQSIARRLATRLTDYDNPVLAAPQRRFLMQELQRRLPERMDFPTLKAEMMAAEVSPLLAGKGPWPTPIESDKTANANLLPAHEPLPLTPSLSPTGGYGVSGVRPSPGAATLRRDLALDQFNALENADLAVAEDGHTPLNTYNGGEGARRAGEGVVHGEGRGEAREEIERSIAAQSVLQRTSLPGLWQFSTPNRRALALVRLDNILSATRALIVFDNSPADVKVTLLPPDLDAAEAFVTLPAGDQMPGWRLALEDRQLFSGSAGRQTMIYLWTGLLAVAGMGVLTVMAVRLVRRQMTLARLKSDLAATVSHELKTPLSAMRVLVDTLLDSETLDEQKTREYLQLIARENERLGRLIQNFLTFARMERRKYIFHFSVLPARQIIDAAIAAVRGRFEAPGCRLVVQIEDPLPPVLADSDALTTALINLLDNACKYSEEIKHVVLRAHACNGSVRLSVTDNGVGIAPRERNKIFRPFYQVDQRLSRRGGGCGLGLSIVQFITAAHHGCVSVESRPGCGSTFTISLPVTPDSSGPTRAAIV